MRDAFFFPEQERLPVRSAEAQLRFGEAPRQLKLFSRTFRVTHREIANAKLCGIPACVFDFNELLPGVGKRVTTEQLREGVQKIGRVVTDIMIPELAFHRSVYVKDLEGSGGGNVSRYFLRNGFLFLQTTNPDVDSLARANVLTTGLGRNVTMWEAFAIKNASREELEQLKQAGDSDAAYRHARRTAVCLGRIGDKETLQNLFSSVTSKFIISKPFDQKPIVVQSEVHGIKIGRRPLELRLFAQRNGSRYRVTHHHAKLGGNAIASNISQGGKVQGTRAALEKAFKQAYPEASGRKLTRMVDSFVKKSVRVAERLMNRSYARGRISVARLGETAFEVRAPPVLSTVDVVPVQGLFGPVPVIMEHHADGDYGMRKDVKDGAISREKWREMMSLHKQNAERLVRESLRQACAIERG